MKVGAVCSEKYTFWLLLELIVTTGFVRERGPIVVLMSCHSENCSLFYMELYGDGLTAGDRL